MKNSILEQFASFSKEKQIEVLEAARIGLRLENVKDSLDISDEYAEQLADEVQLILEISVDGE